jgi:cytochrome P450
VQFADRTQTSSVLSTFILAMLIHPDIQRKAQEEIDRVCNGHLPSLQDVQEDLPYIMAVVLEVMRWSAPAPSGTELIPLDLIRFSHVHSSS